MEKKTIEINIDEQIFDDAQNIYKKLGLSVNDAIKLFLNQTVLFRGLPISLRIPENEDTREPVLEQTPETAQIQNVAEQEISAPKEPAAESVPQEQSVLVEQVASTSSAAAGEGAASTDSADAEKEAASTGPAAAGEEAASTSSAVAGEGSASTDSAATGKKSGSIVDDEEENTDTPTHLFDGWNSSDGK
ncbi:MAG: type II toxin-antitoxin system RelB/DinJ family antitoxin [Treponema sp.]|nr:type II toxin-antitoxin system RelB/DinJ family antitoxin [Treponema sp.]